MKIAAAVLAIGLSAVALTVSSAAEDCPPLAIYARISLQQVPGWNAELVPVEIAGKSKLMLLDTGAYFSTLTSITTHELGLKTYEANMRLYGVTGQGTDIYTSTTFGIGGLKGNGIQFMVTNDDFFGGTGVVGLLGAQILTNYDLSIDFGAHKLDLISPNHCEGQVVYWSERTLTVVPFTLQDKWKIILPVTLDGKEVRAQLDTGASNTTLEKGVAIRRFDIEPGSAETPVHGDLNGKDGLTTWKHRFKSLSIAGVDVANPEVVIIPDKMSSKINTNSTGTLLDQRAQGNRDNPPMLLGMNVLRGLHLYIAYKEKKLYITPAGTSPSAAK